MNPKETTARTGGRAELDDVTRELQLHQIELEEQNRALRDAQCALEESRNRYADLYDFAPIAYCTLDERGCIREVNFTGASLLGRDRMALIGAPLLSVVRMDDPALFWRHIAQCRKPFVKWRPFIGRQVGSQLDHNGTPKDTIRGVRRSSRSRCLSRLRDSRRRRPSPSSAGAGNAAPRC